MGNYYSLHVFMCVNERECEACCQDWDARSLLSHFRRRLKELDMHGAGKVRVNKSGCMDRCQEGPVMAVYPDGVWYRYETAEDIDEIIDSHVVSGTVVERLLI